MSSSHILSTSHEAYYTVGARQVGVKESSPTVRVLGVIGAVVCVLAVSTLWATSSQPSQASVLATLGTLRTPLSQRQLAGQSGVKVPAVPAVRPRNAVPVASTVGRDQGSTQQAATPSGTALEASKYESVSTSGQDGAIDSDETEKVSINSLFFVPMLAAVGLLFAAFRAKRNDYQEIPRLAMVAVSGEEATNDAEPQPEDSEEKGPPKKTHAERVFISTKVVQKITQRLQGHEGTPGTKFSLVLNRVMGAATRSAKYAPYPDEKMDLSASLAFLTSSQGVVEGQDVRLILEVEGAEAGDLIARRALRKSLESTSGFASNLVGGLPEAVANPLNRIFDTVSSANVPFLVPVAGPTVGVAKASPKSALETLIPALDAEEEAYCEAIIELLRVLIGEDVAKVLSGDVGETIQAGTQLLVRFAAVGGSFTNDEVEKVVDSIKDRVMGSDAPEDVELKALAEEISKLSPDDQMALRSLAVGIVRRMYQMLEARSEALRQAGKEASESKDPTSGESKPEPPIEEPPVEVVEPEIQ